MMDPKSQGASFASKPWHLAALLWVGSLWGIQPALIKSAGDQGLDEIATLALVLTAIALLLGGALAFRGRLPPLTRSIVRFMLIASVLEYAAPLLVTFLAARHVDAGLLTLIMSTTPILVVALAAALGSEPLTRQVLAACIVGLIGMALIVVPENALPTREMLPWCLFAFAAPAFYAIGSIFVSRNWPAGFDASQVAFAGSAMAGLLLSPFWVEPFVSGQLAALPGAAWLAIGILVACVLLEMILYFQLLQSAGPVFTSFSSFVMIASGFIAGAVMFGERPSWWVWGSVAMFSVALGLVMTAHRSREH